MGKVINAVFSEDLLQMSSNAIHRGAGVLIIDTSGNAIVNLKDDSGGYPYPGTISLWGGALEHEQQSGHLLCHEKARLAVMRELCEEIQEPSVVTEIFGRLVFFPEMTLPGNQFEPYLFQPALALADPYIFERWYNTFFTDGDIRGGRPRPGIIAPNEGLPHYVPCGKWKTLLQDTENFLGSLDLAIKPLLESYTPLSF